ncbi:unnamed protein product, partial [Ectocarpus sp. 13 AM-2016]
MVEPSSCKVLSTFAMTSLALYAYNDCGTKPSTCSSRMTTTYGVPLGRLTPLCRRRLTRWPTGSKYEACGRRSCALLPTIIGVTSVGYNTEVLSTPLAID